MGVDRIGFLLCRGDAARRLAGVGAALCLAIGGGQAGARGEVGEVELAYGRIDPPVVVQRDITVRLPTSIHPLDMQLRPIECSGVAWVEDRLVITSDRHSHVIFTAAIDLDGPAIDVQLPQPHQVVLSEKHLLLDIEGVAARPDSAGGTWVYLLSSLSNDPDGENRAKRQHITRMRMTTAEAKTQAVNDSGGDPGHDAKGDFGGGSGGDFGGGDTSEGGVRIDDVVILAGQTVRDALSEHFKALDVAEYVSFNVDRGQNTSRWGNVEGITWAPDESRLLCGMRSPLAGSEAMVFVLEGLDKAFDARDPSLIHVTDLFRLDLGGRGISGLAWDPVTQGYLITAALSNGPKLSNDQPYPLENLDSALFWWNGRKSDPPRLAASILDMNIEGVCRLGDSPFIALVSDEGDVSEERMGRQSVLTVMYFMGLESGGGP